jgi:hypothetical protein
MGQRDHKIKHPLHIVSRRGIGTLVIATHPKQTFVPIPHGTLRDMLNNKAQRVDIQVVF